MSDAYDWPRELRIALERDDDALDLNCFACGRDKADMTMTFRNGCERKWIGIHAECAKRISTQETP